MLAEVHCDNFPVAAIPALAEELRGYGAQVDFLDDRSGFCSHSAGLMQFEHTGGVLIVRVLKSRGHFPRLLIIGGIRQTVQEAGERFQQKVQAAFNLQST
jgi:hypothetical protein